MRAAEVNPSMLVHSLSSQCAALGLNPTSVDDYVANGVPFAGDTIIAGDMPALWAHAVLHQELREAGISRAAAPRIAEKYLAVLRNMSKPAYNVVQRGDMFHVGTREFLDRSDALQHERHLHIAMALDALTGGLYFGEMWKRGVVVHTPKIAQTFSRRGAQLIKREVGHALDPATLDRLDFEKWFWDFGRAASGKGQDPLFGVLRVQYNESPLFWGIVARLHAIDRSKAERFNPRIAEMLGSKPRTGRS